MNLSNPSELKEIIGKHNFSFSKSLGQNFLIDENVLEKIVSASEIDGETCALEIGPGAGVLTRELAKRSKKTVAVEIDKKLIPLLTETLSDFDNVKIVNKDIMKTDLKKLFEEEFGNSKIAVVANLPYYITTPVIMKLLEAEADISSITVMVQKEVAERMAASPGGKEYGALSVAVQFYSVPKIITKAEPSCFIPQPKVASSVIKLELCGKPRVSVKNKAVFFKTVKSAFGQRRKTLVNALSKSPYFSLEKEKSAEALRKLGFDENIRGEKLSLEDFARLSDLICTE